MLRGSHRKVDTPQLHVTLSILCILFIITQKPEAESIRWSDISSHTHTHTWCFLCAHQEPHLCVLPLCWPIISSFVFPSPGTVQGVLHTVAGYLLYTSLTFKYVFDHHHDDVYWCTADIGWITGHSYITYGPLANGATSILVSLKFFFVWL